jgi:hypothetical protein
MAESVLDHGPADYRKESLERWVSENLALLIGTDLFPLMHE